MLDLVLMFCDSMSGPKVTTSKQYTQTEYKKRKRKKRQPLSIYVLASHKIESS